MNGNDVEAGSDGYAQFFAGPTRMAVTFPAVEVEIGEGSHIRGSVTVPLAPGMKVLYVAADGTVLCVQHTD